MGSTRLLDNGAGVNGTASAAPLHNGGANVTVLARGGVFVDQIAAQTRQVSRRGCCAVRYKHVPELIKHDVEI